jgi:hypothetical protein
MKYLNKKFSVGISNPRYDEIDWGKGKKKKESHKKQWLCPYCGYVSKTPVPGVDVVEDKHGNLFCAKCAIGHFEHGMWISDDFPRRGRMIPSTIMQYSGDGDE